jgi:hypothetical protein
LRDYWGGFACGWAIACEYDAALVTGGILALVFVTSVKRGFRLVSGSIPPLLLIPIYNWLCMEAPWTIPYSHEAVFTQMHNGFFGIHFPNFDRMVFMLLSPERGLFFWSPFLLLAFWGFHRLFKHRRQLFFLCYFVPLLHIVVLSGYYDWNEGGLFGSRYLAPIIPLLILPAAIGASKFPKLACISAGLSMAFTGTATLVDAHLPIDVKNPLVNYYAHEFIAGNFIYNFGHLFGLSGIPSLLPVLIVFACISSYLFRLLNQDLSHGQRNY